MKTMKRVFAAMITTGLLAVSILNTEAAEIGTFKTAGAGMIANGSPAVAGPLAAGTSKATPAKKTESGSSAAKEKANTQKSTSETTKKTAATSAAKKAATKTSAEKASSAKKAAEKSSTAKTTAAKKDTAKTTAAKQDSSKASTAKKATTQKATTQKATTQKSTTQKAATAKTAAAKTPTIDQAKTSALNALSYRLTSPRTTLYVYRDYGLTQNHFTQRKKIFGSDESLVKTMDENCEKSPYSGSTCIRCE